MSSLAGALDETHVTSFHGFRDLNASPLSRKGAVKEEQDLPNKEEGDQEMDDLFGNDQEVIEPKHEDADSVIASGPESERLASPERDRRQALEYEEEEAPPELAVEVKEAEVAFPNITLPKSSDENNWVIKMPNYVRVDTKPFHPDTYIGPEQEEEEFQQTETIREKTMSIKLRVENTVRWRWTKDKSGRDIKQSNSRIIRWSDGSLSLRLGKELFDVTQMVDTSGTVHRQSIGGSQSQSSQSQSTTGKSQGLTYLVAQHKRSQVLQAEAIITGYMQLRPTGMHSETHRMLVRAVGQKHSKVARLRMAPDPTMDPEREKLELMKQSAKKSRKKADQDDAFGRRRKRRNWRETANRDWTDDEEDAMGASDEEEDDGSGSPRKAKRKEANRKAEEYQEDDFVVADESDEEAAYPSGKKKRREEDTEDALDKLDAKIEEQEETQQPGFEDGTQAGNDADMDIESEEEDEEEFQVRRGGAARPRKRAVNAGQEEDEE